MMLEGVSPKFSIEPSDYLLPPSHKTIMLLDHGPRFGQDANCPIELQVKGEETVSSINRTLWTMGVETALEVHRVISDLFPDGSRLLRFVLADFESKQLSDNWGTDLIDYNELSEQLTDAGLPTEGDMTIDYVPSGVAVAIEALTEITERHSRMSQMPRKEMVVAAKHLSQGFGHSFPRYGNNNDDDLDMVGEYYGGLPLAPLYNKGSIFLCTYVKSDDEVAALAKQVIELIDVRNEDVEALDKNYYQRIDHINLFIFNLYPSGSEMVVTKTMLTEYSPTLSVCVHNCEANGDRLLIAVHGTMFPLFDLVSTTVSGIPMKEEANKSESVNYDVELIHERVAHSELVRHELLFTRKSKSLIDEDAGDDKNEKINVESNADNKTVEEDEQVAKQKEEMQRQVNALREEEDKTEWVPSSSPCIVHPVHDGSYSTVRLTWATPSPKTAWNMFPLTRRCYLVTPALVNSRPSVCLTSFLAAGKNVMLEVKNAPFSSPISIDNRRFIRRACLERIQKTLNMTSSTKGYTRAEKLAALSETKKEVERLKRIPIVERMTSGLRPNLGTGRLISHTLIAHSGNIYIHEIALKGGDAYSDHSTAFSAIKKMPGLRETDFGLLISEMMAAPMTDEQIEVVQQEKEKAMDQDEDEEDDESDEISVYQPNYEARMRALRLTRYWPLRQSHSFIYNITQKFEPMFTLLRNPELSTDDVDKCKNTIKSILAYRDSSDLFTYNTFPCKVIKEAKDRESQMKVLMVELTGHLSNYMNHSERHAEVFYHWCQVSQEPTANDMDCSDVDLSARKKKPMALVRSRLNKQSLKGLAYLNWKAQMRRERSHLCGGHGAKRKMEKEDESTASKPEPEIDDKHRVKIRLMSASSAGRKSSSGPQVKRRPKSALWAPNEVINILDILRAKQDPSMQNPRRDFVGRIDAGNKPAKLYQHLGEVADKPGKAIIG